MGQALTKQILPHDLNAVWTVFKERAGVPDLIGLDVKIQIAQLNPMTRRAVITPAKAAALDAKFAKLFASVKPQVVAVTGDVLLCSCGILARRKA